jgi:hypothetical protein
MSGAAMTMLEAIENRIAEALAADDPTVEWLKPAVRTHRFLPLYLGWSSTLGLRPDGSFVRWDHEASPTELRPLRDGLWRRLAIFQGIKRYPELEALLPARPDEAVPCGACGGSGELAGSPQLVCECGGAGWQIPGEEKVDPPG